MMSHPEDTDALTNHISRVLYEKHMKDPSSPLEGRNRSDASSVLFPLAPRDKNGVCLVLNKRSQKVRQPGDLCFPGGGIAYPFDRILAGILAMPVFPVGRWIRGNGTADTQTAGRLSLHYAAGLREGFEEMRLNPFGVRLLGPLPPQRLSSFRRVIYPIAVWIPRQKRFFPNWEVDKIVRIPLCDLLNPENYASYRLRFDSDIGKLSEGGTRDFPCFRVRRDGENELMWGATYRIAMVFLDRIFGFRPPKTASLPVIRGVIGRSYMTGSA